MELILQLITNLRISGAYQMVFSKFIEFVIPLIDFEKLINILLLIQEGKTKVYMLTSHF